MPTRYIKKTDKLYYAMVVDGKYRLPIVINKSLAQPQYIILSQKKNLYEVMYYNFWQNIQHVDYSSPANTKQMFIPLSHVVHVGELAPKPENLPDSI
jgi:hypothetical protein